MSARPQPVEIPNVAQLQVAPHIYDALGGTFIPACDPELHERSVAEIMDVAVNEGVTELYGHPGRKAAQWSHSPVWAASLGIKTVVWAEYLEGTDSHYALSGISLQSPGVFARRNELEIAIMRKNFTGSIHLRGYGVLNKVISLVPPSPDQAPTIATAAQRIFNVIPLAS